MKYLSGEYTNEYKAHLRSRSFEPFPPDKLHTIYKYVDKECETFSQCCGSGFATPQDFETAVAGVVLCFTQENMVLPKNRGEFTYHQVEGDGEWINIKLLHSGGCYPQSGCMVPLAEYGNAHSLYSGYLKYYREVGVVGNNLYEPLPNGIHLLVLTREQDHRGILNNLEKIGLKLEWTSPTFSNHNYSDDLNRLTMYVLRKGAK